LGRGGFSQPGPLYGAPLPATLTGISWFS